MSFAAHKNRIITGVVLLVLASLALYFQGVLLFVLVALAGGFALLEFYALFWPTGRHFLEKVVGLLLAWGMFWVAMQGHLYWILGLLILSFAFIAVRFLLAYGHGQETELHDWLYMPVGLIYVAVLLSPALALDRIEQILVVLAPVATDAAAYYAGSRFGRSKICPRISPNKSWVGAVSGLVACVVVCVVIGLKWGGLDVFSFMLLGACLSIAGQFGDFFESTLKRVRGVKDSGSLLPGHGGLLDRIDSLLFTVPMYVLLDLFLDFFPS